MKHRVVIFTDNNARLLRVEDLEPFKGMSNVVINPDLNAVDGLPPHLWGLEEGKVVPLLEEHIPERIRHLAENGAKNNPILIQNPVYTRESPKEQVQDVLTTPIERELPRRKYTKYIVLALLLAGLIKVITKCLI